jgi:hypothetical protein
VLEHLHAGDDVVLRRLLDGQILHRDLAIADAGDAGLHGVQLRDLERAAGKVDAEHLGALPAIASARMPPPQPTSSARLPRSPREAVDPVESQRIDLVQRAELALRVPPAVGQFAEFGEFLGSTLLMGRW